MLFPFYEDLSRATFKQLKAIKESEEVVAAWTVGGSIRFRIKDDNSIYKVISLLDTVESLSK